MEMTFNEFVAYKVKPVAEEQQRKRAELEEELEEKRQREEFEMAQRVITMEHTPIDRHKIKDVAVEDFSNFKRQGVFTVDYAGESHRIAWNSTRKGLRFNSDLNQDELSHVFAFLVQEAGLN